MARCSHLVIFYFKEKFCVWVSVKRGVGAGVGVGVTFLYFFVSFFLSFYPNSDFSQFASAVYRYNIFRYTENKENKKKCAGANVFASVTFQSRQSNISFLIQHRFLQQKSISKSSQWKIKHKLTAELNHEQLRFVFNFFKAYVTSKCCAHET